MKTNDPDPYDILHITPAATAREVGRAYRALMRSRHPDTRPAREHGSGPVPTAPYSQKDLQDVMNAYAILGNAEKRAAYDRNHPRPAPTPSTPRKPLARPQGPLLPPASLLIGPVIWEPSTGRSRALLAWPGGSPPPAYTLILRIPR
ncbi:J domain-containing protein [Arthrobacter sp. 2RAF6]|uniref:J domain-containing protein n=1 Tax=Arthrobacter sp. 2RAF6 TaxID=3233002 RepID=UPI003F8FAC8D